MSSVIQKLNKNYYQMRKADSRKYDLGQRRMRLLEELFTSVIMPAAKANGMATFLDIYDPNYKSIKGYKKLDWKGGEPPEHMLLVDKKIMGSREPISAFTQLQETLSYKTEAATVIAMLTKKSRRTGEYVYPVRIDMRRGYETAHVSSPVSNLVQGMSIVDENRPKKSLTDIISNYQARVRGMMSAFGKRGVEGAAEYYADLLANLHKDGHVENFGGTIMLNDRSNKSWIKLSEGTNDALVVSTETSARDGRKILGRTDVYLDNWLHDSHLKKFAY